MKRWAMILGGALAAAAVARWQLARLFTAEPAYAVARRFEGGELRRYEPVVRAETVVTASSQKDAASAGFRRLAGYIFGGNRGRARIAMTAPVTQAAERIAMTTPVTQEALGEGRWRVTFTLPRGRTLDDLPAPNDPSVVLREVPGRLVAVLGYTGLAGPQQVAARARALEDALTRAGLRASGDAESARFDPPWTFPWIRRNEVWIPVEGG